MYSELMMREQGFDAGPSFRAGDAHRRHLASVPDHPRRPDAPRRDDGRGGHRLPGRADELRAAQRPCRDPVVHVPADLPAVVPARADPAAGPAGGRAAPPRRALQPEGLPRHPAAQRVAADQLPPASARRRGRARRDTAEPRAGHPGDRPRGRPLAHRLVARRRRRGRRSDRPPGPDRRTVRRARGTRHPPGRLRRRAFRCAGQPRGRRRHRVADRRPDPARRRGRFGRRDPAGVRRRRDAGRAHHGHRRSPRRPARHAWPSPATGWPSAWIHGRTDWPHSPGSAALPRPSTT